MKCRICQNDKLTQFLDLGFTPPADDFLSREKLKKPEVYYPLEVYVCNDCGLIQLGYVVPPEILFQNEYPYESSTTETGEAVKGLLKYLIVRNFHFEEGLLTIIDGSKGLKKAVEETLGEFTLTQRCHWHKRENVVSYLPEGKRRYLQSQTSTGI